MQSRWDPEQYLRFANERERPFFELLGRVPGDPPAQVVDLGCGPGTSTAALTKRWPLAHVLGIDSSPAMIEQASSLAKPPQLAFELQDIRAFDAPRQSIDLILSNAALQWVPGHLDLFERWSACLASRGRIAIQVPRNFDQPSHRLLFELADLPEWSGRLANVGRDLDLPSPEEYYERLAALDATVDMWQTTYHQVLSGPDPVLEWVKGTALRPYLDALEPKEAAAFTSSYAAALRKAYPPRANGETLFPFQRLFVVARLSS